MSRKIFGIPSNLISRFKRCMDLFFWTITVDVYDINWPTSQIWGNHTRDICPRFLVLFRIMSDIYEVLLEKILIMFPVSMTLKLHVITGIQYILPLRYKIPFLLQRTLNPKHSNFKLTSSKWSISTAAAGRLIGDTVDSWVDESRGWNHFFGNCWLSSCLLELLSIELYHLAKIMQREPHSNSLTGSLNGRYGFCPMYT